MKGFILFKSSFLGLLLICSQLSFAQVDSGAMELEQVNINQADAETIALMLNGVGISRAEAIVSYRDENGSFSSIDDLMMVNGVGEVTVYNNQDKITFE